MNDVLRISDPSREDLDHLLTLSELIALDPNAHSKLLDGGVVVCYFAKPSTRTRLSFSPRQFS